MKTLEMLKKVAEDEKNEAQKISKEVIEFFDNIDMDDEIEPSDVRNMLNDIEAFYQAVVKVGTNLPGINEITKTISRLRDNAEKIAVSLNLMMDDDPQDDLAVLMRFSDNPSGCVLPLLELLKRVDSDVNRVNMNMIAEKKNLIKQGTWSDNKDPRFDEAATEFEKVYTAFQEVE